MDFNRCYGCMRELPAPGAVCPRCGYDNTKDPQEQLSHVLPCGTVLNGKYITGRVLGQGGFGITYIGFDLSLEQPVCVKEYFPAGLAMRSGTQSGIVLWSSGGDTQSLKKGRESFVREAQRAAKLRGLAHVVNVWEVFYENETAYITMEYIEGETLKDRLVRTQKPLGERECVELLTPVMEDLEKAHGLGIIHRDIKPDNIMLRENGEPVLLDMGAAKDLIRAEQNGTLSSTAVVSEGFSPLEQYSNKNKSGPYTDVYAMCATIYYSMTGKVLPTPSEQMMGESIDYSMLSPQMKETLQKGLALRPDERIQTMGELLTALRGQEPDTREQEHQSGNENNGKKPKPKPKLLIPLVAGALLLGAGGYYIGTHRGGAIMTTPVQVVAESAMPTQLPTPTPTPIPTPSGNPISSGQTGELSYAVYNDCVQITGCDKNAVTVEVPDSIEGKPVTSIGTAAFMWCKSLTSITLPDNLASIEALGFCWCDALTSITIPSGVTNIEHEAFSHCGLTSITIPNGVTRIEDYTFNWCTKLTSITLPDSLTSIGNKAFRWCDNLITITIPDNVTSIESETFSGCDSLASITLPESVTSIGDSAFDNCDSLKEIHVKAGSYAAEYFAGDARLVID